MIGESANEDLKITMPKLSNRGQTQFFPDFDGTKDSKFFTQNDEVDSESLSSDDEQIDDSSSTDSEYQYGKEAPEDAPWKNEEYRRLPPNVQKAIDIAEMKKKHTKFFYKLRTLNDKIFIYKSIFYDRMPEHQKKFLERKKQEAEEILRLEKEKADKRMRKMNSQMTRQLSSKSLHFSPTKKSNFGGSSSRLSESPVKIGQSPKTNIESQEINLGLSTQEMMNQFRKKQLSNRSPSKQDNFQAPLESPNRRRRLVSGKMSSHTVTNGHNMTPNQLKDDSTQNSTDMDLSKFNLAKKPLLQLKKTEIYQRDSQEIEEADSIDENTPQGPALRGAAKLQLKLKAERMSNHSSPEPKSGIKTTCFADLKMGASKFFDDDIEIKKKPSERPLKPVILIDEENELEKISSPPTSKYNIKVTQQNEKIVFLHNNSPSKREKVQSTPSFLQGYSAKNQKLADMISQSSRSPSKLGTLDPETLGVHLAKFMLKSSQSKRNIRDSKSMDANAHRSPPKTCRKKKIKTKKIKVKKELLSVKDIYDQQSVNTQKTVTLPAIKKIPKEKKSNAMKINVKEKMRLMSPQPNM